MDQLFPLPITPFEYYYLCDDQAAYPTLFPIELTFSGIFDQRTLESALATVLPRHPLLTARIDMNNGGCPNWIPGEGPQIDWGDDGPEPHSGPIGRPIDLTKSPGLRVIVRAGHGTTRLRCEFHHACCDGRGGCQFLEELLIAYHAASESQTAILPPLDPLTLRTRGEFGVATPTLWSRWREMRRTLGFWIPLLSREPQSLAVPVYTAPPLLRYDPPPGSFHTRVIERGRLELLRRAATAQKASLNDVLLRDLLLVLTEWNAGQRHSGGWLRINVPIGVRKRSQARMPAANVLSFAFLTRKVTAATDPRELLDSIRQETEQYRRDRDRRFYVAGLAFMCNLRPAVIPWALAKRRTFATAVLSNLSKVFEHSPLPRRDGKLVCGDLVLQRVCAVPPIRLLTRVALAVAQYAGEMTISLRWDQACLRPEEAERLLMRYMARLDETAGAISPAIPTAAPQPAPTELQPESAHPVGP